MPPARVFGFAIAALLLWICTPVVAAAQRAAALTDPQIASIAYTAGVIDIENARLALEKSSNQAIRAFARDMIRDHTAINKKVVALIRRLHIIPQNSPASQSLVRQADNVRTQLAALSGEAFDRAYIDNEIAYHKTVDRALETRLIPDARNPQLKRLLATGLKIFEGHEKHAEAIAGKLG
jgi:putative membrane protein